MTVHTDCIHFRGDIPCTPHKQHGVHCDDCNNYQSLTKHILIIKLGAVGDVIRTTPLLQRIRKEYPEAAIWWLTLTPEIVPSVVNTVLRFSHESCLILQAMRFDIVINLDKDLEACALANIIEAKVKKGFLLSSNGKPTPADSHGEHKFITGIFDDISKANTKSYLEEIFEICGWEFAGEEYVLDAAVYSGELIPNERKKIIGLNTGCGDRWVSRLWESSRWEKLILELIENGFFPMLLGGKQEYEKNVELSQLTNAYCPPPRKLDEFTSLLSQCDVIVTGVTMALHLGIGLQKRLVVMNNIFNPNEFELYGRGEIIQPERECKCYFRPSCSNSEYNCMEHLSVEQVMQAIERQISVL
ncbi:MAG: glycosyltransferase family 9 protein [Bacteroidetes bacterium]|nr:glycosyltransferase family 9 protein [Bacteroidota bacterium]